MEIDSISTASGSRRSRRASRASTGQTTTPVLSAEYLNKHSSKNDLVRRMRQVVHDLCDEAVEPDSPDYPGLAGLAAVLVEDRYLKHKDKEVRLHTVLACVEIFYMYAPEPPWDEIEILKIFPQIIQQLANLATCTSPSQPNFEQYFILLEKLATVKIGVVLVEMTKTLESEHDDASAGGPTSDDALEILRELVEVLLHCVHIDHSTEITLHAAYAVSACVEEFDGGVPIPILDEILKCISAGSVMKVTNPDFVKASAKVAAAKRRKDIKANMKLPPRYISQTNPSYVVAEKVVTKTVDRISTPIANLLNGLLNGDPHVIKDSDISCDPPVERIKGSVAECMETETTGDADVWTIVYELHKVSPQILTTVIGTIASSLKHIDEMKRLRVTRLLGRLFYSKTSNIAVNFHPCYREWIRRSVDLSVKVREVMVRHLLELLRNKSSDTNLCEEATEALVKMVKGDPSLDIRLKCIHGICELVHNEQSTSSSSPFISADLLKAVGDRVSSKIKKERLDSITGLAKIYNRHYMLPKIKDVERGGDDCEIGVILDLIHQTCDLDIYGDNAESKPVRGAIRGRPKQSLSPMRRNSTSNSQDDRYEFIPRLVFESACFKDTSDPVLRNRVWTLIDDVLLGTESSVKGPDGKKVYKKTMSATSRAVGLTMIINYFQALNHNVASSGDRSNVYKWLQNLMASRAKLQIALRSYLDAKTKVDSFPNNSDEKIEANAIALQKLESVAALTSPPSACMSPGTTADDLENVLKKLHCARDKHIFRLLASISSPSHSSAARIRALDDLPKRTKSLGSSTSSWVWTLARRVAMGYFLNSDTIYHCILLAIEAFNQGEFEVCRSFLESAQTALRPFPSISDKGFDNLVELFSECSRGSHSAEDKKSIKQHGLLTTLSGMLALSATSRASPTKTGKKGQSPKEDSIIADDVQSQLFNLCTKDGTIEQARNAVVTLASLFENDPDKRMNVFKPLLETMSSSKRLTLSTNGVDNKKIVNVLETLTAMVENVPLLFSSKNGKRDCGAKVIRFAFETVVLGRNAKTPTETQEDMDFQSDNENADKLSKKKSYRKHSRSGEVTLSLTCKRICAAITFLVSHIRATVLNATSKKSSLSQFSKGHIGAIFNVLVDILKDGGLPPSPRDFDACNNEEDKAVLRQCAAVSIMRLCDGNLQLEKSFFTYSMWLILGRSFLDIESTVRGAVMTELSHMLTGEGIYNRTIPSLRFLAYITLCPDCDSHSSNATNASAANIGQKGKIIKEAALKCATTLRRTCETTLLRCRAASRQAEKNFEKNLKLLLMPEYAVPYAFHLLALRPETPSSKLNRKTGEFADSNKMLRKRLNWLLEPLVKSLGESADNISFLLRQSEMLGHYIPVDVSPSSDQTVTDDASLCSTISGHDNVFQSRLKVICSASRDVLMKFVKKDVNLTPYPGGIQFPAALFRVAKTVTPMSSSKNEDDGELVASLDEAKNKSVHDPGEKSDRYNHDEDSLSPSSAKLSASKRDLDNLELQLSPIPQSKSPDSGNILKTPVSGDGRLSNISTGSNNSTRRRPTRGSKRNSSASSGDKRRRQPAQSTKDPIVEKKRRSTPTDDSDFSFEDDLSTGRNVSKSKKRGSRISSGKKTAVKVGISPKFAKQKADVSPVSTETKSTRISHSSASSSNTTPTPPRKGFRRSSRLSRD